MAFDLEKKKNLLKRKSSINTWRCVHSTIHLPTQTRGKTMQSVNYTTVTYTIKNTFIFRKNNFIYSLKKVEMTQLDEKIFVRLSRQLEMVNWKAYRKDRNLLQNNPNSHGYLRKNPNVSQCTAHNIFQSPLSLWASNLRLLIAL